MVISSIDLKDGHVVQLKNGKELVLQRDDADALIGEFNIYGEVAIIDLDAALGNVNPKGDTVNTVLLKSLLRKGNVRTGGGIHTVKRAKELISLGAEKVIIGSSAWKKDVSSGESPLNTEFLEELISSIGKQRIIISVDAIDGKIAVKGWTETVDISLIDGAREAEKYCSELLFTCVEKEGCMQGTNMEMAKALREAVKCRVVVAGGVSSEDEIVALEKIGCDVQLGMALYTGKVSLKNAFIRCLNWEKAEAQSNGAKGANASNVLSPQNNAQDTSKDASGSGDFKDFKDSTDLAGSPSQNEMQGVQNTQNPLLPVIAQSVNGEVLMMGYANREALEKTFDSRKLTFFSRTRQKLWTKGESSGHFLEVVKLRADCDRDTILATVKPHGGACHTGSWTCFSAEADEKSSLERLYATISERFANPKPGSYTATLDDKRVREKVEEEAEELCEAEGKDEVIWEAADLLYFASVLMYRESVTWQDVYDELDRRHKK